MAACSGLRSTLTRKVKIKNSLSSASKMSSGAASQNQNHQCLSGNG